MHGKQPNHSQFNPSAGFDQIKVGLGLSDFWALMTGNPSRLKLTIEPARARGIDKIKSFQREAKQTVILTGATGYVGMHILHHLLGDERIERVFVILRPHPTQPLEQRLANAVRPYRLMLQNKAKITYLAGDIGRERLGLASADWARLAGEATMIIHSASSTNHAHPYPHFRKTSVRALLDLAALSITLRQKQLHIIGSVGCEAFQSLRDFYRFDFYRCGYTRMKWIVKHLAHTLTSNGISAYTYMLPFVLGGAATKYKDPGLHYAFWQMIKTVKDVGQVWDSQDALIPVVPATTLAEKIVANAFAETPAVWSFPALSLDGDDLAAALEVAPAPWQDFRKALTKSAPFFALEKHRGGIFSRARSAFQKALFVRALFPADFPQIMLATSEASRADAIHPTDQLSHIEYLRNCARTNSIIK